MSARDKAATDPQTLMPGDWGMYASQMDCVKPKRALDILGCKLVRAIWNGEMVAIRAAVETVRSTQMVFREFGAADTEGRHALQDVMEAACVGTPIDFEKLWALVG